MEEKFEARVRELVSEIEYKPGYKLLLEIDKKDPEGRLYLQVEFHRRDVVTGEMGFGRGGKGYLSEHMTDSEIIRRALALFLSYEEHECREHFKWRGRRVFGPHIDVEGLWEVAERLERRS